MDTRRTRVAILIGLAISSMCAAGACTSTTRQFDGAGGAGGAQTGGGGEGGEGVSQGGGGSTACVGESDSDLCAAQGYDCGDAQATDQCGADRMLSCGDCTLPARCAGAGEANRCGEHPPLNGIDGYILQQGTLGGPYSITFATDGVASAGGFCCATTVDDARQAYPGKNLLWLPGQIQITAGEVPKLTAVDGYIVPSATGQLEILYAIDGALSGGGACCADTVDTARAMEPNKNLGYLPFFSL